MVYGTSQWWFSWDQNEHGESDYVEPLGLPAGVMEPPSLIRLFLPRRHRSQTRRTSCPTLGVRQSRRIRGICPARYEDQTFSEGVRRRSDSRPDASPGPLSAASSLADCGSEKARRGSRDAPCSSHG